MVPAFSLVKITDEFNLYKNVYIRLPEKSHIEIVGLPLKFTPNPSTVS